MKKILLLLHILIFTSIALFGCAGYTEEDVDAAHKEGYEQAVSNYMDSTPSSSEIYDIVYDALIEDGKYSEDEAIDTAEFIMDSLYSLYNQHTGWYQYHGR